MSFCGQTCHTVMQPEFTAYQSSPHSRVECVKCHIGPGAGWFVRSKLSGVRQVFAVTFNTYPRPIPTPVHNLRPARETCEAATGRKSLWRRPAARSLPSSPTTRPTHATKTVLLLKIGGGNGTQGIHGTHLGPGVRIRYAPADEQRQTIPWVEYSDAQRQDHGIHRRRRQGRDARQSGRFARWTAWIATTGRRTRTNCRSRRWITPWRQERFRRAAVRQEDQRGDAEGGV